MGRNQGFSSTRWRLHGARLGSFLANARAIRELADDARRKYDGDFVFDRQYVVTVIERTTERLDALLFDARVLGVDTSSLERTSAQCKAAGRAISAPGAAAATSASGERDDPAYSLLARCSEWMDGPADVDGSCVMSLLRLTTDLVAEVVDEDRELEVQAPVPELTYAAGRLRVADLGGGVEVTDEGRLSVRDIHCRPLGVLLAGAAEGAAGAGGGENRWLAVVDRRHVSLRRERRGTRFLLEATLAGESRTDWVFVYSTRGAPPEVPGMRSEPTERGWVSWQSGDESVDQVLVGLGAEILGG